MNRGKMLILAMLTAGLTAGAVAWWFQYHQGVRVLELWDAEMAYQIRLAPNCELLRLSQTKSEGEEQLAIGDAAWTIRDRADIGEARGLVHARQALISDASYDWEQAAVTNPVWTEAIAFGAGDQKKTFALDLEKGVIRNLDGGNQANLSPIITSGLRTFFDEQWAEQTP